MNSSLEVRKFITLMQQQYIESFTNNDKEGMAETSYALAKVYAVIGNMALASKWAHECNKHMSDPIKLASLHMALICGVLKKKLSNSN